MDAVITDWQQRDPDNWDEQLKAWNVVYTEDGDEEPEVTKTYTAKEFLALYAERAGGYPYLDRDDDSALCGYSYRIIDDCECPGSTECRAYWIPGDDD